MNVHHLEAVQGRPAVLSGLLFSAPFLLALLLALPLASGLTGCASGSSGGLSGTGGSLARFAVHGHHLYVLGHTELRVFNVRNGQHPRRGETQHVGPGLETLFLHGDRLFVGARTGMYIYDVSVPESPQHLAFTGHFESCDPVVVRGNIAFVTLREGTQCRRGTNALQVYDVSEPRRPRLIATYPMHNPWGLGVDGWRLFVADGKAGLKVFDARDPKNLVLMETLTELTGYDVIPNRGVLIVSAVDGLYQFDYHQGRLLQLSRLQMGPPAAGAPDLRIATQPPASKVRLPGPTPSAPEMPPPAR